MIGHKSFVPENHTLSGRKEPLEAETWGMASFLLGARKYRLSIPCIVDIDEGEQASIRAPGYTPHGLSSPIGEDLVNM